MKSIFITDQHFGVRSDSSVFVANYEKFYSECFFPTVDALGIKVVVCLGDTWEDRTKLGWKTFDAARAMFFDPLRDRGIKLIMIYGNHDVVYRNNNSVNGIDFFEDLYENIQIVKTREVVDIGVPLGLCGWINKSNFEESMEWIAGLKEQGVRHLGGHFEIKEFEMTKGQLAPHGLDRKIFKDFDSVWSGHFHVRSTQGNITYLSNPSQTNWGDVGLDKGFHVFDSETNEMVPYNNPFAMYKEIRWGVDKAKPEDFAGVYGRIHVPAFESVGRAELDLFVNAANEVSPGVQVVEGGVSMNEAEEANDESGMTTRVIIDNYIDDVVGDRADIDATLLKRMFTELLDDAHSKMEID